MVSISIGASSKLDKSGGTLTGPLILSRDPLGALEAATRQFVLTNGGGIPPSTVTAKGDLLAATAAGAVTRLGAGSDGQILTAASGQPTGLAWAPAPSAPGPASSVAPETTYSQSQAVGTATTYAREDHTHGSPSLAATAPAAVHGIGSAAALGTATLPARADHAHPMAAAALPGTSAVADSPANGTATTFAASDHKHGREGFGSVTALSAFGAASSDGVSTSLSRADHAHGAPSLLAAGTGTAGIIRIDGTATDITALGTQAAGATGLAADAGHVHPTTGLVLLANAASTVQSGTAYGTASAPGTSANYAREDHQHGTVTLTSSAPATSLGVGQGAAVGTAVTPARADHVHPLASAGLPGSCAVADSAAAGSATTFAASDHRHGRESFGSTVAATVFGAASVNGSAVGIPRSDHVHGLPDAYSFDTPKQRGFSEWNFPPSVGVAVSQNFTSGTIYGVSLIAQSANTISKVAAQVVSSASTPTAGQNLIGFYTVSGTTATQQSITGDLTTWGSAGLQQYALGASQALVPGNTYILLFLSVATTAVHLQGITSDTAAQIGFLNIGLSNSAAPWLRFFVQATGQSALPASFTISAATMSPTNALAPWAVLL